MSDIRTFYRLARQTGPINYMTLDQHLLPANHVYDSSFDPINNLNQHGQRARGIDIIIMECTRLFSDAEVIYGNGRYIVIEKNQKLEGGKIVESKTARYLDEKNFTATKERIRQASRDREHRRAAPRFSVYEMLFEKRAVFEGEGTKEGVKIPFAYVRTPKGLQAEIIYEKSKGAISRQYLPPQTNYQSSGFSRQTRKSKSVIDADQLALFSEADKDKKSKIIPIREGIEISPEDEVPF